MSIVGFAEEYIAFLAALMSVLGVWITIRSRWFRYHFDSARLKMGEATDKGHRLSEEGQDRTWLHIEITNASNRRYVPARNVAVVCTAVAVFDGRSYKEKYIPGEFPLQWVYSRKPPIRAIYVRDSVDIGYLYKEGTYMVFRLAMSDYQEKWKLPIEIRSDKTKPSKMRVHLRVESDGFVSKDSYVYEIDLTKDLEKKWEGKVSIGEKVS